MSGTIFGVGPLEIVMIVVLVLLVFGPDRLPGLMRDAGKSIKSVRKFVESFTGEFQKEVAPFAKDIDEATKDLRNDLATIREAADFRSLIKPIDLMGGALATTAVETPVAEAAPRSIAATDDAAAPSESFPLATDGVEAPAQAAQVPVPSTDVTVDNPWFTGKAPHDPTAEVADDNPWRS